MIELVSLTKRFGSLTAAQDVSLTVARGEIFALLGPNGAGKTTTIKMLATLLRPTEGSAYIGGFDVQKNTREARRHFGIVFQESSLDDQMTAIQNIEFYSRLYGLSRNYALSRAEELLREFALWDRRFDNVRTYSGGMRRRLEVIRSLLHRPQLLILDEPTAGLDPQTRVQLWKYLKRLQAAEDLTIFLTTHYLEEVDKVADRLAIIDHGKLITQGTAAQVKQRTASETLDEAFIALTGEVLRPA